MTEEDYHRYVAAFNDMRYDEMVAFYDPKVELVLPANTVHGRDGIKAHYQWLHQHVRELLEIPWLMVAEDKLAAEIYTEFHCHKDLPTFSMGPLRAGDVFRCTNFGHYDLTDGLFTHIRVGRYLVHDD